MTTPTFDEANSVFEAFRDDLLALVTKPEVFAEPGVVAKEALEAFDECLALARLQGRLVGPPVNAHESIPNSVWTGAWEHYKGGDYLVLFIARHHESRQPMVVYVSQEHGTINVRPLHGYPGDPDGWVTPLADGSPRFFRPL